MKFQLPRELSVMGQTLNDKFCSCTYYQLYFVLDKFRLNGILAGYGKLQVKSPMGQMINEEPYFHLDVVSDFWVFRYVQYVIHLN